MNKNKKVLIIGFGSIGQRHYKNLQELGFRSVSVYDVDTTKTNKRGLKRVKNLSMATLKHFDIAFICNPINLHVKTAIRCAEAGCHIFIEKPFSHNLDKLDELEKICQEKGLINIIACNMRFHPCMKFVKDYLNSARLGKIYRISHEYGYYLPKWRPGQDYKENYAARKETGGGIILDDIHEFDLLFWLNDFREIKESKFVYEKIGDLKIETEDICAAVFKFKDNVIGTVNCDYLQKQETRNCEIVGEDGTLNVDLIKNTVVLKDESGEKKLFALNRKDDNEDYISEIKYFMRCVEVKKKTFNDIALARNILRYCVKR